MITRIITFREYLEEIVEAHFEEEMYGWIEEKFNDMFYELDDKQLLSSFKEEIMRYRTSTPFHRQEVHLRKTNTDGSEDKTEA